MVDSDVNAFLARLPDDERVAQPLPADLVAALVKARIAETTKHRRED